MRLISLISIFVVLATSSVFAAPSKSKIPKAKPRYQDNDFKKANKSVASIWPSVPFYEGGDLGQYVKTMTQDRDSVRKEFFGELMTALEKMADKGAAVELMLEPMANILMMFDQMHDIHKMKDVARVDISLENQFKAALDDLFLSYDVRDQDRQIQFSAGTNSQLLQAYIRRISFKKPLGKPITEEELNVKYALEIYEQVDYLSYGTFSSLGKGMFKVTYHLQGFKNGVTRNFIANGPLTAAVNAVALQVFDYFQKNQYPDWETPYAQLQWLPMPNVQMDETDPASGYTFSEAKTYCESRGYRLPYARELIMAQSGGQYKVGGIQNLELHTPYPVLDRRRVNENHLLTLAHRSNTGGPIQADFFPPLKGKFWCVKGTATPDILIFEKLWKLSRQYRPTNEKVFVAVETIRFELGDFDIDMIWSKNLEPLPRLEGIDEAMQVLQDHGIHLQLPPSLRRAE